jgi:hypothetical protein
LREKAKLVGGDTIGCRQPELIDAAGGNRLSVQAVSRDLMSRAGEADRPHRPLLAIAYHGDDGHARKIGRLTRYDGGDEKGERQDSENPGRTPPEEFRIPVPHDPKASRQMIRAQPALCRGAG